MKHVWLIWIGSGDDREWMLDWFLTKATAVQFARRYAADHLVDMPMGVARFNAAHTKGQAR